MTKPSPRQAAALVKTFWGSCKEKKFDLGLLDQHPWIAHERAPSSIGASSTSYAFMHRAVREPVDRRLISYGLQNKLPLEVRDQKGRTVLHALVDEYQSGFPAEEQWHWARQLIEAGARCDVVDFEGRPLWLARHGQVDPSLVEVFLRNGSPVVSLDAVGRPWVADLCQHFNQSDDTAANLRALVRAGAPINVVPPEGVALAPLVTSLRANDIETVQLMNEMGANPALLDRFGNTPLHSANSGFMVNWLIARGAALEAENCFGRTPLVQILNYIAEANFNSVNLAEAARVLIAAGANLDATDWQITQRSARELVERCAKKAPTLEATVRGVDARSAAAETVATRDSVLPLGARGPQRP